MPGLPRYNGGLAGRKWTHTLHTRATDWPEISRITAKHWSDHSHAVTVESSLAPQAPTPQPNQTDRALRRPRLAIRTKHDGFRALAYFEDGRCELVSRKDNV